MPNYSILRVRPELYETYLPLRFPTTVRAKTDRAEELMKISYQLLAIGILYLMPLASTAQEVVPYANSEVKVD